MQEQYKTADQTNASLSCGRCSGPCYHFQYHEAPLLQRDCKMLHVIEYFAKSLKVTLE